MAEDIKKLSSRLDTSELELKETIDDMAKGWSTDEMIDLLAECEFALVHNQGRIEQLRASGLKRLCLIISGINRRNNLQVQENVQEIQQVAFKIQKIVLKRIDLMNSALIGLNDKVNCQSFLTQEVINNLLQKLEKLSDKNVKGELSFWQNNVRYFETKSGKKYTEVSDGMKILLVVSDLFQIVSDRSSLIDRPFLETVLKDKLDIRDQISVSEFYDNIIDEKECISLYAKDEYRNWAEKASVYGQTIYKISSFYLDERMRELADSENRELHDMCKAVYVDKLRKKAALIDTVYLCQTLLNDLACMYSDYQIQMEKTKQLEEEEKRRLTDFSGNAANDKDNKGITEIKAKGNNGTEYSVLRLTPEGSWLFRDGNLSYSKTEHKNDYSFLDEGMVKAYIDSAAPGVVTVPAGYYDVCMPEIKKILSGRYLSLSDYYMFLWFRNMKADERRNKKVVFIDYYAHDLYVSGYDVDSAGSSYRKRFPEPKLVIRFNKIKKNIKNPILEAMNNSGNHIWQTLGWEEIVCFKTFTAEKYIDEKLSAIGVRTVSDTWEDILKEDSDTLGELIRRIESNSKQ